MPVLHDLELGDLTKQLTSLQSDFVSFGRRSELQRVIELIKIKNGWTTPAELAFAMSIVKSMHAQLTQLNEMVVSFEAAAKMVEVRKGVLQ